VRSGSSSTINILFIFGENASEFTIKLRLSAYGASPYITN
jgi:hypothetical protein